MISIAFGQKITVFKIPSRQHVNGRINSNNDSRHGSIEIEANTNIKILIDLIYAPC